MEASGGDFRERTSNGTTRTPKRWVDSGTSDPTTGVRSDTPTMVQCSIPLCSAARGPRWVYESPETAIHDPASAEEWPHQDPYTDLSFRLVPSEDPFYYALLDDTSVHKTGRRATVAARDAMEVLVETISWGYPPSIFHDFTTFVIKVDPTVSWTNIGTSSLIGASSLHLCKKPIDAFQCIRPTIMNAAVMLLWKAPQTTFSS
jgi:hypothetical protein